MVAPIVLIAHIEGKKILKIVVCAAITYGKNLNALTSKLFEVKASLMSSSEQDELQGKREDVVSYL